MSGLNTYYATLSFGGGAQKTVTAQAKSQTEAREVLRRSYPQLTRCVFVGEPVPVKNGNTSWALGEK